MPFSIYAFLHFVYLSNPWPREMKQYSSMFQFILFHAALTKIGSCKLKLMSHRCGKGENGEGCTIFTVSSQVFAVKQFEIRR